MEGLSWTIFRGFVVRIPSAPITASEEVETCRCVTTTGQVSSVACSAVRPANRGFRSVRGRCYSARCSRRRRSSPCSSMSTKAAASARPVAWWASIGTR